MDKNIDTPACASSVIIRWALQAQINPHFYVQYAEFIRWGAARAYD